MGRKTFVLDTNVLLHDPDAITKFTDNDVVMPLVVLEELDRLKRSSDELGKNARQVVRHLDMIKGNLFDGIEMENGVHFSIHMSKLGERAKDFPLPLDSNKHRILYTAYLLQKEGKEVVILVSKDFVLRIKAESIGLQAEDYLSLSESYDELYKGLRQLTVDKRDLDLFLKDGAFDVKGETYFPNEFAQLYAGEQGSALAKFNPDTGLLEPMRALEKAVWGVSPLNDEQRCAMDLLLRDDIKLMTMIGPAGTGKTLLALTCGLKKLFDDGLYKRILVSRPIMPLGKDIGYLPGTKEEKMYHWMQPIFDNLEYICEATSGEENGKEAKQWIMESDKIEVEAVTYIRGRSLPKTYIIIDEAQNLTPHEVKTIISRAGHGTKVILTGDPTQIDNPYLDKDSNGLTYIVSKFKSQRIFGTMFFDKTERSELSAIAAKIL